MKLSATFIARLAGACLVGFLVLFSQDDPLAATAVAVIAGAVVVFLINLQILRSQARRTNPAISRAEELKRLDDQG